MRRWIWMPSKRGTWEMAPEAMSLARCEALQELGYQAEVVIGTWGGDNGHAWVEAEGFILDVTLTQFEPGQPRHKVVKAKSARLYKP